jgi:hypothetical protein
LGHRDTVAPLIVVCGSFQFKTVEGNALLAYTDLCQPWPDITVEQVLVHAKKGRGVAESHESWSQSSFGRPAESGR